MEPLSGPPWRRCMADRHPMPGMRAIVSCGRCGLRFCGSCADSHDCYPDGMYVDAEEMWTIKDGRAFLACPANVRPPAPIADALERTRGGYLKRVVPLPTREVLAEWLLTAVYEQRDTPGELADTVLALLARDGQQ